VIIIIFYSDEKGPGKRLLSDIQARIHGYRIDIESSVEALCDRFHHPILDRTIMILVPENREQLEQLVSIGNLINDRPILLVLPDKEPTTISIGHRLYPRFVTYVDSDFSNLVSVLSRLLHHASKGNLMEGRKESGPYLFLQPDACYDIKKHHPTEWKHISNIGSVEEN